MEIKLDYINKRNRQLNHLCRVFAFVILMIPIAFSDELLRPFTDRYTLNLISPVVGQILYYLLLFLFFVFLVKQINKLIPFKTGKIFLSEDMIKLDTKGKTSIFYIADIDSLTFVKDLPYKNDKRWETQKKSNLKFTHKNKSYDLEICIPTEKEFDAIRPITQAWKEKLKSYKQVWG